MSEEHNLETYEQLYLLNMESQYRAVISDIMKFIEDKKLGKEPDVENTKDFIYAIDILRRYEKYFLYCESISKKLEEKGKYQLSEKLGYILGDIRGTIHIFECANDNLRIPFP